MSSDTQLDPAAIQASLQLLEEVADFLGRLPPVPVTRDLERKVRTHLLSPEAVGLAMRSKAMAQEHETLAAIKTGLIQEGVCGYSPTGLPEIIVQLRYPILRVEAPAAYAEWLKDGPGAADKAQEIGERLAQGLNIKLTPVDLQFRRPTSSGRVIDIKD